MCKFAKRCINFLADPKNERACVIICNKNPSLMMIFEAPDRYVADVMDEPIEEGQIILKDMASEERKKAMKKLSPDERKEKNIEDLIKVIDNNTGEVVDFEAEFKDIVKTVYTDPMEVMKKSKTNLTTDPKLVKAIEGEEPQEAQMFIVDDVTVERTEIEKVADENDKKPNVKNYIPTGNVGRPKMTDEAKAEAKAIRDAEKIITDAEKLIRDTERGERLKQRRLDGLAKAREARRKKKEEEETQEE